MKKIMSVLFSGIILTACNVTPTKQNVSVSQADLEKIQRNGMALYEVMQSSDASDELTSREADLLEMASEELLCDGEYQAVRIEDRGLNIEKIYLILQPPKESGIQVGRHLRFDFALGTNDLDELTLSTKTCLLIPQSEESVAAFVTHLLSPIPSEFHVYLSLLHGQAIYVSTDLGLWKVENGTISKPEA